MIFPFRHRIGMAALISACLILALCFFRGEMFFMRKSRVVEYTADDRFSLKVYTNYFNFGFPGQGSDVPCYVVLCRNGWRVGGGWIDMLQRWRGIVKRQECRFPEKGELRLTGHTGQPGPPGL